jgi:hypothetical protein
VAVVARAPDTRVSVHPDRSAVPERSLAFTLRLEAAPQGTTWRRAIRIEGDASFVSTRTSGRRGRPRGDQACGALGNRLHVVVRPGAYYRPAVDSQQFVRVGIASPVAFELRAPPLGIRLRPRPMLGTSMPKAPVYEDRDSGHRKRKVGAASHPWQFPVDSEAKAKPM